MESREDPTVTRPLSSATDPKVPVRTEDGNIGSDEVGSSVPSTHVEAVTKLAQLFENGADSLDLAIMQVIAGGGSPSDWIAGMLRASLPAELPEPSPRPRFLGE